MNPRNQIQSSWTSIPEEFSFKVLNALEAEFAKQAKAGEFIVEGKIFDNEILIRIGYLERGRLRQINFEASVDYDRESSEILDSFYLCVDSLGLWMHEYFEKAEQDEDQDLPLTWRPAEFKNNTVFMQFSTVNSRLEQEADRILGMSSSALFNEEIAGEDAFEHAIIDPDLSSEKDQSTH